MCVSLVTRSIGQLQRSAMLLSYALDNGEAKACSFLAGRDVGFDKPMPILLRQTHAIVDNINCEPLIQGTQANQNLPLFYSLAILRLIGIDAFARVFHKICNGLGQKTAVAQRFQRIAQEIDFEFDFRAAHLEQNHGLAHDMANVMRFEDSCRHPREGRKFIDHPPNIANVADNGFRAAVKISRSVVM